MNRNSTYIEKVQRIIRQNSVICLLILVIVIAAHGVGIFNGYTWDDKYLIPQAKELSSNNNIVSVLQDVFTDRQTGSSSNVGSYYRPLRTLLFVFITSLPGSHTIYLHTLSILLHTLVSYMVFYVAYSLCKERLFPLLWSLVFAAHPVTTESVASISNIKELLSTLFVLITIYYLHHFTQIYHIKLRSSAALALFTFFGLVSKETALVIPIMSFVMLVLHREHTKKLLYRGVFPIMLVTAFYLLLIIYVSPGPEQGEYILGDLWITLYTTAGAFIEYFKLFLWPLFLSIRHDIAWIVTPLNWKVLTVTIFICALIFWADQLAEHKDHRALPVSYLVVSLLPVSNILPLIGHVMSERYMYMILSALCITAATLSYREQYKQYIVPLMLIMIIVLACRSTMRTLEWKDDRTLFESAVKVAPDALVVRANLNRIYSSTGEHEKARNEYDEMIRINIESVGKFIFFAKQHEADGDHEAARKIWELAERSASGSKHFLDIVRSERYKNKFSIDVPSTINNKN